MGRSAAADDANHVPIARQVPGGPKLLRWLESHEKTQLWLAKKTEIGQQLVSAYINQLARPVPMSPKAARIQEATEGAITIWDWMTPDERKSYRKVDLSGKG